jgi:hypothetical protein
LLAVGLGTVLASPFRSGSAEDVLATLTPGHPRLLLTDADVTRLRDLIARDPTARRYYAALIRVGKKMLGEATSARILIGPRLLSVSRRVLTCTETLGLLYRLDGDRRWFDRLWAELDAVAAFADWNPPHFLDVAEMTHAFALGYDWLHRDLTDAQRTLVRTAIVTKGLQPAAIEHDRRTSWTKATHNWNLVCNGGITAGALAVAEDEPELARFLVDRAIATAPRALASYGPDGAWIEGPGYWTYATDYATLLWSALTSATGDDGGLSAGPGIADTGVFRLHVAGPTGLFFNFADAGESAGDEPALFWLAERFNQPALAAAARVSAGVRPSARDLLWFSPIGSAEDIAALPTDARYAATDLAFLRSGWNDPQALYVGFKGGNNAANHSHLDLGTFVFDALGQRWAIDLGSDDYNLPEYFGRQRWTYYRLRTEGHNTLLLDGANQSPTARARIVAFDARPEGTHAIADLTAAYLASGANRVRRGVGLIDGRTSLLVQDEWVGLRARELIWTLHTRATVIVDGPRAVLRLGGEICAARILAPDGANFVAEPVSIPRPQRPATDVTRLTVRLVDPAPNGRIAIVLTPGQASVADRIVTPLVHWLGYDRLA